MAYIKYYLEGKRCFLEKKLFFVALVATKRRRLIPRIFGGMVVATPHAWLMEHIPVRRATILV
jgi:hypothetical protein